MDVIGGSFRAMRNPQLATTIADLRREIVSAGTEATTGRVADPVTHLGTGQGTRLSLDDTAARADTIATANRLFGARLSAVQDTLGQFGAQASQLSQSLVVSVSGALPKDTLAKAADTAVTAMRAIANTRLDGRSLLGGDRSDVAPIAGLDAATARLEVMFVAEFGFASDDAAASGLSGERVAAFLTDTALPALQTTVWDADIGRAGAPASARIAPGETVSLGPTADDAAIRAGLTGALAIAHFAGSALSEDAVQGAAKVALNAVSQAGSDIAAVQGEVGLDQSRIEQASERLIAQGERMRESADASVAVDAFEAAARFSELATQLEAAYTMTTRIHQLTLLRFLS